MSYACCNEWQRFMMGHFPEWEASVQRGHLLGGLYWASCLILRDVLKDVSAFLSLHTGSIQRLGWRGRQIARVCDWQECTVHR